MREKELPQDFEYDGAMKKSTKIVITIITVFYWVLVFGILLEVPLVMI